MKASIFGATGSLGQALAHEYAKAGHELLLVASDLRDLQAVKSDLEVRYGVKVSIAVLSLGKGMEDEFISNFFKANQDFDLHLFPLGLSDENDRGHLGSDQISLIFEVNALFFIRFSSFLLKTKSFGAGGATLVACGSIAETRGRDSNAVYAAAKRALTSYLESLCFISQDKPLKAFLFQIGYMESTQTDGKRLLFPLIKSAAAASKIRTIVEGGSGGVFYLPSFWRWVCFVLKALPWFLYRKLKF